MEPILLGTKEAAKALGLSERSIFWLVSTGQLASRKLGKRRLIPREAIEKFARRDHKRIRPQNQREGEQPHLGGKRNE